MEVKVSLDSKVSWPFTKVADLLDVPYNLLEPLLGLVPAPKIETHYFGPDSEPTLVLSGGGKSVKVDLSPKKLMLGIVGGNAITTPEKVMASKALIEALKELNSFIKEGQQMKTLETVTFQSMDPSFLTKKATTATSAAAVLKKKIPVVTDPNKRVKLANADDVMVPVFGTDEKSTYFCVAIRQDLKFAARINGDGGFSLRAEGSGLLAYKNVFEELGIKVNFNKDGGLSHASIHAIAPSSKQAWIAVTALLSGIGVEFDKVVYYLSPIIGKGT